MRNLKRTLMLVLALVLVLSVVPMGAMAVENMDPMDPGASSGPVGDGEFLVPDFFEGKEKSELIELSLGYHPGAVYMDSYLFPDVKDNLGCNYDFNALGILPPVNEKTGVDPEKYIFTYKGVYELQGVHLIDWDDISDENGALDVTKAQKYLKTLPLQNAMDEFDIPAPPEDEAGFKAWWENYGTIILAYAPHKHTMTQWYYTPTNHFRNCLTCGMTLQDMNWHFDGDSDGKCDVCKGEIVFYKLNIAATENGTVKTDKNAYSLYDRFYPEIEPAAGYVVDEVHLIQHNDVRSEAIRYTDDSNGKIYYEMPPYECDLVVTFKAK